VHLFRPQPGAEGEGEAVVIEVRKVFLFLAVTLLALNATTLSAAQNSDSCPQVNLPAPVIGLLEAKFSDWRPKQVSDLEAGDRQLWLKAHARECPGVIVGHFESKDRLTYTALLVPKSEPTGGYQLVVFTKETSGENYVWKLLDHADGQTYSGLVISKALPGRYSDVASGKAIQTRLDGIYVEWIEKGAYLYYWSAGRYHKLQVSD
jgi:hypothetical protein